MVGHLYCARLYMIGLTCDVALANSMIAMSTLNLSLVPEGSALYKLQSKRSLEPGKKQVTDLAPVTFSAIPWKVGPPLL